jgi:ribosome-associated protein
MEGERLDLQTRDTVLKLCEALYDKKAADIKAIYVEDKTIIAEWFVIASGHSMIQVRTLSDELEDKAAEFGLELRRKEGYTEGKWVVLDFANILVHVFYPEERKFFNMERLWADDPRGIVEYSADREREAQ